MDTSSEYINMCEKALKIFSVEYEIPCIGLIGAPRIWWHNENPFWFDGEILIRLFTQDQLQGMVIHKYDDLFQLNRAICDFSYTDGINYYAEKFNSMEQLWLAFVMKEKFNKVWDGEDWAEQEK